jgi:hypothetical protein
MSSAKERRQHPRRAVSVVVTHKSAGGQKAQRDVALDISQGGLFLKTSRRSTLGETLHVEITPPSSDKTIRATATVARVTPEGIGAAFTELDSDSALLLNLLLSV